MSWLLCLIFGHRMGSWPTYPDSDVWHGCERCDAMYHRPSKGCCDT